MPVCPTFPVGCLRLQPAHAYIPNTTHAFTTASTVQFLPMPVVGGYLAYIGFFCGQAGLALMANVEIVHLADWR